MNLEQVKYRISRLSDSHARRCATHLSEHLRARQKNYRHKGAQKRAEDPLRGDTHGVIDRHGWREEWNFHSPYQFVFDEFDLEECSNHSPRKRALLFVMCRKCGSATVKTPSGRKCLFCKHEIRYRKTIHCILCGRKLTRKQTIARRGTIQISRRLRHGPDWWPGGPFCSQECHYASRTKRN